MTSSNSTSKFFYTYAHYRADQPERGPFYIGKGMGQRAWKPQGRSNWWTRTAKKHGVHVEIIAHWTTEDEAYSHERLLIGCMRDIGIKVVNKNDGGDGASNPAPEVRAAIRERTNQQWNDPAQRAKLIQSQTSPDAIARRSASLKRAFSRPGSRERRSASLKAANQRPEIIAKRQAITSSHEYRQKMSESLKAARARPEVMAKHDAANAKKVAANAARKALEPTQVKMTKREASLLAAESRRVKTEARRALLPPEERARLEKQAADRLRNRNRQRQREREALKRRPENWRQMPLL